MDSLNSLDVVQNPTHYDRGGISPIDFIMSNKIEFPEGSAIKYTFRHAQKNGAQDLMKAIQNLQFILEKTYGVRTAFTTLD